jgi:hypothetical protein
MLSRIAKRLTGKKSDIMRENKGIIIDDLHLLALSVGYYLIRKPAPGDQRRWKNK